MSNGGGYEQCRAEFQALLLRARLGDADALAEVVAVLKPHAERMIRRELQLRRHARSTLGRDRPSDLFQQACVKVVRDFASFKGQTEAEFTAWFREIVRHTCLDGRKLLYAKKRRAARELPLDDARCSAEELVDREPTAEDLAEKGEGHEAFRRALEALPVEQRELIERRELRGESLADLAASLHKSADAVRKACSRAREHLRRLLHVS